MNIKRSIQIDGADYTDKLLSVSDVNIGVRDLGLGYISDITVDLVFDSSLLNAKGKTATIGFFVSSKSYIYNGIIRNIRIKDNKAELSISHLLSVKQFLNENYIFGDNTAFATKATIKEKNSANVVPEYVCELGNISSSEYEIVNTYSYYVLGGYIFKPSSVFKLNKKFYSIFFKSYSFSINANGYLSCNKLDIIENQKWDTDGNYIIFKNPAEHEQMLKIDDGKYHVYGRTKQDSSTVQKEDNLDSYKLIDPEIYPEVKIVRDTTLSVGIDIPTFNILYNAEINQDNQENFTVFLKILKTSKPEDIIEQILSDNGFSNITKIISSKNINLNFKDEANSKDIIQKAAEQGLLYVVPTLDADFQIIPSGEGTSSYTFSEFDYLERTFSIDIEETEFDKLKVNWNKAVLPGSDKKLPEQGATSYYGSGIRKKEYNADYIADQTSADNFANAYLDYYQKQKYVSFETPIYYKYLDLDVGDIVTVSHSLYGINQDFQIIEKSIRDESIKFKCKEI